MQTTNGGYRLVAHAACGVVATRRAARVSVVSLLVPFQKRKPALLVVFHCFLNPDMRLFFALQTLARVKLCEVLDRASLDEACSQVGFSTGSRPTLSCGGRRGVVTAVLALHEMLTLSSIR